jgi:hypothetical protein
MAIGIEDQGYAEQNRLYDQRRANALAQQQATHPGGSGVLPEEDMGDYMGPALLRKQTSLLVGKGDYLIDLAKAQYGDRWREGMALMIKDNEIKSNKYGSPLIYKGDTLIANDLDAYTAQSQQNMRDYGNAVIGNNDKGLVYKAALELRARQEREYQAGLADIAQTLTNFTAGQARTSQNINAGNVGAVVQEEGGFKKGVEAAMGGAAIVLSPFGQAMDFVSDLANRNLGTAWQTDRTNSMYQFASDRFDNNAHTATTMTALNGFRAVAEPVLQGVDVGSRALSFAYAATTGNEPLKVTSYSMMARAFDSGELKLSGSLLDSNTYKAAINYHAGLGAAETVTTVVTSLVGESVGGVTMILTGGDVDAGHAVRDAFIQRPETAIGQAQLAGLGATMSPVAHAFESARSVSGDFGYGAFGDSPLVGAAITAVPDFLATMLAPQARGATLSVGRGVVAESTALARGARGVVGDAAEALRARGLPDFNIRMEGPQPGVLYSNPIPKIGLERIGNGANSEVSRGYISGFSELRQKVIAARNGDVGAMGELEVAKILRSEGTNVHFQTPVGPRGPGTADFLVGGERRTGLGGAVTDVLTPRTSKPANVLLSIADKNNQAPNIIVNLRHTSITPQQLGDVMPGIRALGASDIQTVRIVK